MRILIAEDDLTSRTVLEAVLKKEGHEVLAAVNGADAWALMQQEDAPSLAILDWMMPEMDGPELVRNVRSQQGERPAYIIMLTTKDDKSDIVAALEAGADDYLTKPFDTGELRARVDVGRRTIALQEALADQAEELRKALDEIKTLSGIIPICATCKKIRDDNGYWNQVEVYIRNHSDASFSHGICPDCMAKFEEQLLKEKAELNPSEYPEH
jgi:CheY-like chemotaxis protein